MSSTKSHDRRWEHSGKHQESHNIPSPMTNVCLVYYDLGQQERNQYTAHTKYHKGITSFKRLNFAYVVMVPNSYKLYRNLPESAISS